MSETKVVALREAINLAMSEEMRKDEKIILMGEDTKTFQSVHHVVIVILCYEIFFPLFFPILSKRKILLRCP